MKKVYRASYRRGFILPLILGLALILGILGLFILQYFQQNTVETSDVYKTKESCETKTGKSCYQSGCKLEKNAARSGSSACKSYTWAPKTIDQSTPKPVFIDPREILLFDDIPGWEKTKFRYHFNCDAYEIGYQSPNFSVFESAIHNGMGIYLCAENLSSASLEADYEKSLTDQYTREPKKLTLNGISGYSYYYDNFYTNQYYLKLYHKPYVVTVRVDSQDQKTFLNNQATLNTFLSSIKFK